MTTWHYLRHIVNDNDTSVYINIIKMYIGQDYVNDDDDISAENPALKCILAKKQDIWHCQR